jgi:hypothetical protein
MVQEKMSGQIFISYRREESKWSARSLHDRLSAHFDPKQEIAMALKRDVKVIPVLVDGASMPLSTDLPDDLKPLTSLNALRG